jgi:hypothetical protein
MRDREYVFVNDELHYVHRLPDGHVVLEPAHTHLNEWPSSMSDAQRGPFGLACHHARLLTQYEVLPSVPVEEAA